MTSHECVFCEPDNFADRQISSNGLARAFLSAPRLTAGHSLVVPKRHVELPSELTAEEVVAISELINPIHRKLLGSIALGVDVWQKSRPQVGEDGVKVDHVHYHVLPSMPGDEMYGEALNWRRPQFSPLAVEERDTMLALLQPESAS